MTPYTLVRARRYSISLQINANGELVVRAPYLYPTYLINRFVESKTGWITKRLKAANEHSNKVRTRFVSDLELQAMVRDHVARYSSLMGVRARGIRFKTVNTYWGSCAASGVISFNLRLAYTSPQAVEYVVVHELAHLRWKGHGVRFWDMVTKYYPNTKEVRKYLRSIPRSI